MAVAVIKERVENVAKLLREPGNDSRQPALHMLEGIIRDCMTFAVPENIISTLLEAFYSIELEDSTAADSFGYKAPREVGETGRPKFRITESQLLFFVGRYRFKAFSSL